MAVHDERPDARWTPSRKADVVADVCSARTSISDALQRYALSKEELAGWIRQYRRHGLRGLSVLRLQELRK